MSGGEHGDPLSKESLFHHVHDSDKLEFSTWLTGRFSHGAEVPSVPLPKLMAGTIAPGTAPYVKPFDLQVTKFMVIEVMAAILICLPFIWLAGKLKNGARPQGKFWNFLEVFLVFIRNQIAHANIGHHDGDKYVPYLWTIFFFILGCNLLGLVPYLGSPTGDISLTIVLALATFATVIQCGVAHHGPIGFILAQVPHMELPVYMLPIKFMIFVIEIIGLFVKHFVLSIRLFANMLAGHIVLAVLVAFIAKAWGSWLLVGVLPASIGASIGVMLLEVFVAFLQAYIFTFLSALFIGAAAHSH